MFKNILIDYIKEHTHNELLLLIFISIILSIFFATLFTRFSDIFVSSLMAVYSIFAGFLFNLMVMLSNMAKEITISNAEPQSRTELKKMKLQVIERGLKIISASILFAIINIVLMLLYLLNWQFIKYIKINLNIVCILQHIFIGIVDFFIIIFLNSLYKILNITHILLQKDIELKFKDFI